MKRVFSVFAAVMLAVSAFCAGHSWNDDIFGCRIGVSTIEDVRNAVTKAHRTFEPLEDEGSFIAYDIWLHDTLLDVVTFDFDDGVLKQVFFFCNYGDPIGRYISAVREGEAVHGRGKHFSVDNTSMVMWEVEGMSVHYILEELKRFYVLFAGPDL